MKTKIKNFKKFYENLDTEKLSSCAYSDEKISEYKAQSDLIIGRLFEKRVIGGHIYG